MINKRKKENKKKERMVVTVGGSLKIKWVKVVDLTCCSTVWFSKANIHTRAWHFIASIVYTEKLRTLYLQRGKASIRFAPWDVSTCDTAPYDLLIPSPAKWVSLWTKKNNVVKRCKIKVNIVPILLSMGKGSRKCKGRDVSYSIKPLSCA